MNLKGMAYVVKDSVSTTCPKCNHLTVNPLNNKKPRSLKIKCASCKYEFEVAVNYRRLIRKEVNFDCSILDKQGNKYRAVILDISLGGIGFALQNKNKSFQMDDVVSLRFLLNDKKQSQVDISVQVKAVNDRGYGGIFVNEKFTASMKAIGFWFML